LLQRFVRGVNHHWGRPWWYGIAVVVVMYLPWSLSLPPALVQANPWNPTWRKAERWQTLPLFAATWFAAGFGIFALSSTQVHTTPSVSSSMSSDAIVYVCAL
jgi:4-amino-4-deoxy-L-arabinose transferase-like glycosyltransferase